MPRDRAAYMREYRKAKKAAHERYDTAKPLIGDLKSKLTQARTRITELEEEVRHLKAELAKRPESYDWALRGATASYNTRPFTPVPKVRKK